MANPEAPNVNASITTTVPLGNKAFATPYHSVGREILQNMILENSITEFSKAQYYLLKIPGLRRFGEIPSTNLGACRGLFTCSNYRTFIANNNRLSEVLADGTVTFIGFLNSWTGPVSMAENGNLMMIVDGTAGYILRFTDNNFTRITDEYFPGVDAGTLAPTKVTYLDTYFICNVPNTDQYYYSTSYYVRDHDDTSSPYDPAEPNGYWSPLLSGRKIGKADNINCLINCNNYLWLFGYNSCEIHYDTGDYNGQLFARYQGAILNIGCKAPNSVAVFNNQVFFLGSDIAGNLGVFSNEGLAPVRISTKGIDQMIEEIGDWSDCIGYTYAQSSHMFYVMQFPKGDKTFVYDISNASWHERTYLDKPLGLLHAWKGMFATNNFGKMIMGDNASSAIYHLDPKYYQNDNAMDTGINYIKCVKNTPIQFQNGVNIRYNWVQVICNQGSGTPVNNAAGVGIVPQVQISWSEFGYGSATRGANERTAPIGVEGDYSKRSRVLALGIGRNRVYNIAMSDPVPFILVALLINVSQCKW